MKQYATTPQDGGNVRIDKYLAEIHPEYSRAALAKLFDLNLIKRDGEYLRPGEKLRPGTTFEYDLGPLQAVPDVIPLPILYEDDDVVVIDKPAGIISHARGRFWQEASVASFIRDKVSSATGDRAGIVHRLDRATSGVMICAKHESALVFLQKEFSKRNVQKTYIAIVDHALKEPKAIIDAPILRNPTNPKRFMVHPDGKHAETYYEIIKDTPHGQLVKLMPKTGRTHQLRVHLQYLHSPIVGDDLYDGTPASRLMLHAQSLEIMLPSGKLTRFESPIPSIFKEVISDSH